MGKYTREDLRKAREAVNDRDIRTVYSFKKSKGRNKYNCPICGSGTGPNRTGALTISDDGRHITCFAGGCFGSQGEDVLGALKTLWGVEEREVFKRLGVTVEKPGARESTGTEPPSSQPPPPLQQTEPVEAQEVEQEPDYIDFFKEAHARIGETDYPQRRGLSQETIDRFKLGYVAEWRHPAVPATVPTSPRLIIPTGKGSYIARDTRRNEAIPESAREYAKQKAGKLRLFNMRSLEKAAKPVYVVEGELDALSIIEVGGEAVALGSTAMMGRFVEAIQEKPPNVPLIIAMDRDEAGKEAAGDLRERLEALGVLFYTHSPFLGCKDANEALLLDREAFKEAIRAGEVLREAEAYKNESAAARIQLFIDGISDSINTPCIPTGFRNLDEQLDGGLYPSLTVIAGNSSLGKTSFVLQIADQVAQRGTDVILFSLEMSEAELMSKSISRHTLAEAQKQKLSTQNAKTARGITDGNRYPNYNVTEHKLIRDAIRAYEAYAGRIYIIRSGMKRMGANEIRAAIDRHINITGRKPLCVVDYLQIMKPESDRMTDKQAADSTISSLKNISADTNTALIAISSVGRGQYDKKISLASAKESGGIEYGCDIVLGMQFKGAGESSFDETISKKKNPRDIEVVILKNRNGPVGGKVAFRYYPLFNLFEEEAN